MSAPFGDISGYAQAAREYAVGFYNAGIDVQTHFVNYDHRRGTNEKFSDPEIMGILNKIRINNIFMRCNSFICHSTPNISYMNPEAKKNVLYSVWETSHIPRSFEKRLSKFDLVLTPSQFSMNAFKKIMPDLNICIVPHIIHDFSKQNIEVNKELSNKLTDKFVFLWSGEWHIGKGYDVILESFCRAFQHNKKVVLLLKTYNLSESNIKDKVIKTIKKVKENLNIGQYPVIIPLIGDAYYNDVLSFYKLADVFINSSRREGWGLCSSEAFGFGLLVIAPDKGGHREFLNRKNSILFDSKWVDVFKLESSRSFYEGQKWIEPSKESLIEALRNAYNFHDQFYRRTCVERHKTLEKFSSRNVIKKFLHYLI